MVVEGWGWVAVAAAGWDWDLAVAAAASCAQCAQLAALLPSFLSSAIRESHGLSQNEPRLAG